MWPFSEQKTLEASGLSRRKSFWIWRRSKDGCCKKIIAVLLLQWSISSSTASLRCPGHKCSCPDYTTTICTGYLADNFTNLLDSRLLKLILRNTNITEVACTTLPEDIETLLLQENQKLQRIFFNCNWMRTVRYLEISSAKMSELDPITEQYIGSLNSSDYPMLGSLQKLHLSNLRIGNKLGLLLTFLDNITELQLNHCEIQPLMNIAPKLSYVKLLDLSYNPIKNINAEFFRSMVNLNTLQLEWTKLTNISKDIFHSLEKLSILRLDGNNLTSFNDDTFLKLENLRKLRLSRNQIKYFQSTLTRSLTKLEELYLNSNNLTELEQVFDPLVNLKVLNLTQNFLTNIHKMIFKKQQKLLKLYLGWNRLEKIEAATLAPLRNLHTLNLERNRLTFLEENTFVKLSKLKLLNISGNFLVEISGVQFPQRAALQQLSLERNSLENIDPMTFSSLEELESLRLDGNSFQNVKVEVFEHLSSLKYLNLSECNMLRCSCSLEELWRICKQRNITLADGAICNADNNHSMQLSSLKICPLVKYETQYINIIIIVSVLLLVLVVSFSVGIYLFKRAPSEALVWSPQNNINVDNSVNRQKEEDFVSAEEKAEFSKVEMVHQEEYIEPIVSKVILPICKPLENPRKAKRLKVSVTSKPVPTSFEITVPQCRAPAAPPEEYSNIYFLNL